MSHAFLMTHYGSGGTLLCRLLHSCPNICCSATGLDYNHPTVLYLLQERIQETFPYSSSINTLIIDKVVLNHLFSCKSLLNSRFIYLIREPIKSLPSIINRGYSANCAADYYTFRLRRICEMASKTSGIVLNYDDIISDNLKALQDYLGIKKIPRRFTPYPWDEANLKTGEVLDNPSEPLVSISDDVIERCLKAYHRYSTFLLQLS